MILQPQFVMPGQATSEAWSPLNENLAFWFDTQISILTYSGSTITEVEDLSPNGLDMGIISGTPTNGTINGINSIYYSLSTAHYAPASSLLSGNSGICIVCLCASSNTKGNSGPLGVWSGGSNKWVYTSVDFASPNRSRFYVNGTGTSQSTSSVNDGNPKILIGIYNPGGLFASRVNGGDQRSATAPSAPNSSAYRMIVGSMYNDGLNGYLGNIGAVMVFYGESTVALAEKAEGYISHNWNLTSLLPSNHPYKTVAP